MKKIIIGLALILSIAEGSLAAFPPIEELTQLEADYILQCQYLNPWHPAHGAINNVFGDPSFVVPRENGLAILALIESARILNDNSYIDQAQLSADYLVRIQDTDGGWFDQYNFENPAVLSKSPTQAAEVMMAFDKLGYDPARYNTMQNGAQFLLSLQDPINKGGLDDGLISGGIKDTGDFHTWRWTSDNSFGYWAFKAAEKWAILEGEFAFANQLRDAAADLLNGMNQALYVTDQLSADYKVWHRCIDENHNVPTECELSEWISYAPQMIDVPAEGVGDAAVGQWIHDVLQAPDGAVVFDSQIFTDRKSPGFSFQASLSWLDLGQEDFADDARDWALASGLWQTVPDGIGVEGGWIDWEERGTFAPEWQRFIDTSFYAITASDGGYDFSFPNLLQSPQATKALDNSTVNFQWADMAGAGMYWLYVGTALGGRDIYNQSQGLNLSATVTGVPITGDQVYVRLWIFINNVWVNRDFVYKTQGPAGCVNPGPGVMQNPVNGSILPGDSVNFIWNAGNCAEQYWLHVGTIPGKKNIYTQSQGLNTNVTVKGIPTDGKPVYVRLWTFVDRVWVFEDYVYQASAGGGCVAPAKADILTPVPGAALTDSSVTFNWSTGNCVDQYWLHIGTFPGKKDVYTQSQGLSTSVTVNGISLVGNPVYVRLWSNVESVWQFNDYVYQTQ